MTRGPMPHRRRNAACRRPQRAGERRERWGWSGRPPAAGRQPWRSAWRQSIHRASSSNSHEQKAAQTGARRPTTVPKVTNFVTIVMIPLIATAGCKAFSPAFGQTMFGPKLCSNARSAQKIRLPAVGAVWYDKANTERSGRNCHVPGMNTNYVLNKRRVVLLDGTEGK